MVWKDWSLFKKYIVVYLVLTIAAYPVIILFQTWLSVSNYSGETGAMVFVALVYILPIILGIYFILISSATWLGIEIYKKKDDSIIKKGAFYLVSIILVISFLWILFLYGTCGMGEYELCVLGKARILKNPQYCENANERDSCYFEYFTLYPETRDCSLISKMAWQYEPCLIREVGDTNNAELCKEFTQIRLKDSCYRDTFQCDKISDQDLKFECERNVALQKNDIEKCTELSVSIERAKCYLQFPDEKIKGFALKINNIEPCGSISNYEYKLSCYAKFPESLWPQWVRDKGLKLK